MGKQEANIYEIAREAGVSIATVSRVINHSAPVSEKSTRRVMAAIQKLNYVPSITARSLSTSTSTSIGVVIPDINNPFFSQLLRGITRVADEKGYHIFLFNTDESSDREHQMLRSMREHRLRGIIATPVSELDDETVEILEGFQRVGIPVVLLDREVDSMTFDRVLSDDVQGVYEAVSALLSIGHRRIGYISGAELSRPGKERLRGYRRALLEAGITPDPKYIRPGNFKVDMAYEQTKLLCAMDPPPTAIFASNNMTTYGCLRAFAELGLEVGKDIALIGFDDIEELSWLSYSISVVSRDVPKMGETAMQLLAQRFEGTQESETGIRTILPTEVVLRGSELIRPRGK